MAAAAAAAAAAAVGAGDNSSSSESGSGSNPPPATGKPDQFEPHYDQVVEEHNGTRSLVTILVYLNDGGGEDDSMAGCEVLGDDED